MAIGKGLGSSSNLKGDRPTITCSIIVLMVTEVLIKNLTTLLSSVCGINASTAALCDYLTDSRIF